MRKAKGSGSRERRAFSAEFKVDAVRLLRERQQLGVSVAQIGRELDVGPDVLRRWARQVEDRAGRPPRGCLPGEWAAAGGRGGAAAVAAGECGAAPGAGFFRTCGSVLREGIAMRYACIARAG